MSRYGKGWRRDPGIAALHYGARLLADDSPPPPSAMALLDKTPPIWSQGDYSSCVGFAWARSLSTMTGDVFSPIAVYTLARCVDRPAPEVPIQDVGSMPYQAARAIERWGVASHDAWPLVGINDEPDVDQLEACERFNEFSPQVITTYGAARSLDVRRAIAAGFPIVFGVDVDAAFEAYSGGVLLTTAGGLGGHYLCALGYETTAAGGVVFHGANSWGAWGERGFFRFSESFLDCAGDLYFAKVTR